MEEAVFVIVNGKNKIDAPRDEEVESCILVVAVLEGDTEVDDRERLDLDAVRERLLTDGTLIPWTVLTVTATGVERVLVVELLVAAPIVPEGLLFSAT